MFETRKLEAIISASIDIGNGLNTRSTVLKHKAALVNYSYADGTHSLLYYENLLRQTEKRPLSEYSINKTKTILVWTENWDLWNEMPK